MSPAGNRPRRGHQDVVVYADGGSRGNPGPAGYGAVVLAGDGTVLAEGAGAIGRATNNVAEYRGLIAGLTLAAELGAARVTMRMDSKLVIEQMSGRWKVRHPAMKPLAAQAAELVRRFDAVQFEWVPRSRNAHADRLANEAMDDAAAGREWAPRRPQIRGGSGELSDGDDLTGSDMDGSDMDGDDLAGSDLAVSDIAGGDDFSDGQMAGGAEPADRPGARSTGRDPAADLAIRHPGTTRFLVVRHGESTWGSQAKFAGRQDVPLSSRGLLQADAAAARIRPFGPSIVISSPLERCRRTAAAIAGAAAARTVVDDRLNDGTLGSWTGYRAVEIEQQWPREFARWRSDPDVAPPGGESFTQIRDRVRPLIKELYAEHPGRTVVLVTHAAPAKMIVASALQADSSIAYRVRLDPGSLSGFDIQPNGSVMVWIVNDVGHLVG